MDTTESCDLISVEALKDFFDVIGRCQSDFLHDLGSAVKLKSILLEIDPEVSLPPDSALVPNTHGIELLLSSLNDSTNAKYGALLKHLQGQISTLNEDDEIPLDLRRSLGEVILIFSVESSRATEVVGKIVSELSEETQLSIQTTIQKYAVNDAEYTKASEMLSMGELSLASSSGEETVRSPPRLPQTPSNRVPPLSLGLLHRHLSIKQEKIDSRRPSDDTTSVWKEKYEALKLVRIIWFVVCEETPHIKSVHWRDDALSDNL